MKNLTAKKTTSFFSVLMLLSLIPIRIGSNLKNGWGVLLIIIGIIILIGAFFFGVISALEDSEEEKMKNKYN